MDVQETRTVLAAAREYYLLRLLEPGFTVAHDRIRRDMCVSADEYSKIRMLLAGQGLIRSYSGGCILTWSGMYLVRSIRIRTLKVMQKWSADSACSSGILIPGESPDIGDLCGFVRSVGGTDVVLYRVDGGGLVRESEGSRTLLGSAAAEEMGVLFGLTGGCSLAVAGADTAGEADVAATALGILYAGSRRGRPSSPLSSASTPFPRPITI